MSDSSEHLSLDRRKFLAGALATLSSKLLPINSIIGSPAVATTVTPEMLAAFKANINYRASMRLLFEISTSYSCINKDMASRISAAKEISLATDELSNLYLNEASQIAQEVAEFEHSGYIEFLENAGEFPEMLDELRQSQPTLKTIVDMLSDPAFHDVPNGHYRYHIEGKDIEEAAKSLYELSRTTPEEYKAVCEEFVQSHRDAMRELAKVAHENPAISKLIQEEAAEIKARENPPETNIQYARPMGTAAACAYTARWVRDSNR